jgi:hypothetical protein
VGVHRLGDRRARTRLWDLAYALHGFVPLSADPRPQRPDADRRMRILVDAYRLDEAQRRALLGLLATRTRSMADFLTTQATLGSQPWTQLWRDGHERVWRADATYIERHTDDWTQALLG